MLETPGTFNVGGYGQEIHEMTEMRAVAMGQYGHNNQPAHHFLYLFALLGEHDTTARTVR
jgi:putative alpha-1,2-mannosidase